MNKPDPSGPIRRSNTRAKTGAKCVFALLLASGCSSEAPGNGPEMTGGSLASGGSAATGGASGGALSMTGGASSGGAPAVGGSASGGLSSGGGPAGGAAAGGTSSGGAAASGGAADGGSSSGGSENLAAVAEALVGLRIDDACTGNPPVSVGATCDHAMRTGAGYHGAKEITIGGTEGTVYDVTLRVRGVVEPANVVGGSRSGTETFSYMNLNWRTVPFTTGGMVPVDDADYAQWRIVVGEPEAEYFLNDYQRVGHYIFELDYEVTLSMAAGTTVTLEGIDNNERLIMNYEDYGPEGVDGSVNYGQFIELDVISVEAQ